MRAGCSVHRSRDSIAGFRGNRCIEGKNTHCCSFQSLGPRLSDRQPRSVDGIPHVTEQCLGNLSDNGGKNLPSRNCLLTKVSCEVGQQANDVFLKSVCIILAFGS